MWEKNKRMVFIENGVGNFYPKPTQLSCSECEILAKCFTQCFFSGPLGGGKFPPLSFEFPPPKQ